MVTISTEDPVALAAVSAIHAGDVAALRTLLADNPDLATARLGDDEPRGMTRSLLHVATDWPGHFPNGAQTVAALVEAGADVNARFTGPHTETPLHWAASSDDVDVLDALLDAGADIEAPGSVLGGGAPHADAVGFAQWNAARRLVERGATIGLWDAAALGLMDRIEDFFASEYHRRGRDRPSILGRLPRRPTRGGSVPARPRGRPQLDPDLGEPNPPGRRGTQRLQRRGRLVAQPRRPVGATAGLVTAHAA